MNNFCNINKIALGSAQFGSDYGVSNNQGQTSLSEIKNILLFCQENNIDTLDTAMAYGSSEENLGKFALQKFNIISKFIVSDDNVENLFKQSLNNLNLSALYAYLYHRPLEANKDNWRHLQCLKEKGNIYKIGFSFNTLDETSFVLDKGFIPDLIQIPFNIFDDRFQNIAIELRNKYNTEIHTRSTFLQGLFFIKASELNDYFTPIRNILEKLQKAYKNDLPTYLMHYVLQQNFIDKIVLGVNNKTQLKNNMDALLNFSAEKSLEHIFVEDKYRIPSLWKI